MEKLIIGAIISFVFTGLIGNRLIQRWQQTNWFNQHRIQGAVQEFDELRKVIDELMTLSSARQYRMRKVVLNLKNATPELIRTLMDDYSIATTNWNDKLVPLSIGLRVFASSSYTDRLELEIQLPFVELGTDIEEAAKMVEAQTKVSMKATAKLEMRLNSLSGSIYNFSCELIRELQRKQRRAYEGEKVIFNQKNLRFFSTWYLFKALFQSRKYPQTVSSSSVDILPPLFIRPQWSGENEHSSQL